MTDNVIVDRVLFYTWTEKDGQDDIVEQYGTRTGDTFTCRVKRSDHKGETGNYITHIYSFDYAGNESAIKACITKIGDNPEGSCDLIDGNIGSITIGGWAVDRDSKQEPVEIHVYIGGPAGEGEGHSGIIADNYRPDVPISLNDSSVGEYHGFHETIYTNKTGEQEVYVYAINVEGGMDTFLSKKTVYIEPDFVKPTVSNIKIDNITEDGYTVSCKVTDNVTVKKVVFSTWTEDGNQDDRVEENGKKEDDIYTYRVKRSMHNNECGKYVTHIFAYDYTGNYSVVSAGRTDLGHIEVIDKAIAATCETAGKTEGSHCSICGKVLKEQEIIKATGHKEVIDKGIAATCETAGKTEGSHCSICGKVLKEQEIIKATGHKEVIDKGIAATCETAGKTEGSHCRVCGKVLKEQEIIKATGHKEVIDKGIAATCETAGKTEGSHCRVCGKVLKKQEVIPASGHVWDEGKVQEEATCMEKGRMIYHCIYCDETKTEDIPAVGHDLICINRREATCTEEGYTGDDYCTACRKVINTGKNIPRINHQWNEGEVIREATYDETGIKKYTCIHCGTEKIEEIPKRKKPSENGENQNPNNSTGTPSSNNKGNGTGNEKKDSKIRNIRISGISTKIAAGKKVRLTADVLPGNARNKTVLWTSSNTKAATVSKDGVVKISKKAGGKKVTITACAADGSGVKANFQIKVMKGVVKKLSLKGNGTVKAGKSLKMTAKIIATKGANKKLIWSSNNPKYATVSPAGKIKTSKTAKGKRVKITVMATDGSNKKATVMIKIK